MTDETHAFKNVPPCKSCGAEITSQQGRSRARRRGYGYCSQACEASVKAKRAQEGLSIRFLRSVDMRADDECWPFLGQKSHAGYGAFNCRLPGEKRSTPHIASRLMYMVLNGPIPPGQNVCHSCDNPACCNPGHLWLGSQADNMADMGHKGRGSKAGLKGTAHPMSKLTVDDVQAIRASSDARTALASRYGVTEANIHRIKTRRTWKHLP